MKHKTHIVVIDPIPFNGGSKVATANVLRQLDHEEVRISVLTADKQAWGNANFTKMSFFEFGFLENKEQGIAYFLRHLVIAFYLLLLRLRFGKIDITVGASGPGVDLAMYMVKPFLKQNIIQFIHGPVATSRTIARCLNHADQVYYLHSTLGSIHKTLRVLGPVEQDLPAHFCLFENGLCDEDWPTQCQIHSPVIFWAASLLKWKGLDLLLEALKGIDTLLRPQTHICYIKPHSTQLAITDAPVSLNKVKWYESPAHIDKLRASANIFISSSKNEPFGLSILEAMAAGMCVLIPADDAYWDHILEDNINCIKYQPDNAQDLQQKILMLNKNMPTVIKMGQAAAQLALHYRASVQYQDIKKNIEMLCRCAPDSTLVNG
ncbi:glycosyltransferase family 4 protein [Psychromonas sp. Urea-02u-13]|uniref:glycosyltransferase family 4 protein n=1 Tax=Psychromonas sp. Urea-02u-13 TaxID=2058326 RepID=UPI000C327EC3|nr:glycosyltransferase family 4 protein [Psychromonas sp. Urea-02u-13]PKG37907.1 glycosyltransferase [Psychromonas sp. Urea-02u-13]